MRFPYLQNPKNLLQWSHQLINKLEFLIKPVYNNKVTLEANQTTTVVSNGGIFIGDHVFLQALTLNASLENTFITNIQNGSFTINHANLATTDRTFSYIIATANSEV